MAGDSRAEADHEQQPGKNEQVTWRAHVIKSGANLLIPMTIAQNTQEARKLPIRLSRRYGFAMWITSDGVTHTNAHATPTECMTERMVASLAFIAENEGEAGVDAVFQECFHPPTDDELVHLTSGLENQWIPDEYLDGEFKTSGELAAYLKSVAIDWRLDAVHAVDDVLTSLTEDS